MKYLFTSLFLAFLVSTACSQSFSSSKEQIEDQQPVEEAAPVDSRNLQTIIKEEGISKNALSVKIDKSAYTLQVFHKDTVLITYPCVFGFDEVNDKKQEGDGCTPEGTFGIRSKYPHKSWKYFIWIDYPNKESWSKFKTRKANGEIDDEATIGGEIGIHGVPEGGDSMISDKMNWTLGCISLTNKNIEDLYKSISSSTKILIVK